VESGKSKAKSGKSKAESIKNKGMKMKSCPECGKEFRCEGDNDCWCEGKQIHKAQMFEMMQRYTNCICPDCLKKYEAKE